MDNYLLYEFDWEGNRPSNDDTPIKTYEKFRKLYDHLERCLRKDLKCICPDNLTAENCPIHGLRGI